jgi:hypothetical protein
MLCGCGCSGAGDGAGDGDGDGDGEGACEGPWRPRSPGLAAAGIRGIPEPLPLVGAEATSPLAAVFDFAARECPGATADTSAATPAVSAAAAAMTQRRVRTIRASAASRASTAPDFDESTCPSLELTVARESVPRKSSMRIACK